MGPDSHREGTGADEMSKEGKTQPVNLKGLRLLTKNDAGAERGALARLASKERLTCKVSRKIKLPGRC